MSQYIGRRGLASLAIVSMIVASAMLAWQAGSPGTASAQAPTGAMGLSIIGADCAGDNCTLAPNSDFSIAIVATEVPAVDIGGFQSEVFFDGITWNEAGCAAEVQVARQDAQPIGSCTADAGAAGQARHVLISEIAAPPLPAFEMASGDTLILLSATCVSGVHTLALTAVTNSANDAPFGALYFDTETTAILVTPQGTADLDPEGDGSTTPIAVADTVTVNCDPATPTSEPPTPVSPAPTIVSTGSGGPMAGDGTSIALLVAAMTLLAATVGGYGLYRWRAARTA